MTSIKKKLTLFIVVVLLIPLVTTTLFSTHFFLSKVEQEAITNLRQDIKVASLIYLSKLNELKHFVAQLAADRSLVVALEEQESGRLKFLLKRYLDQREVTQITILDVKGRVMLDLPSGAEPGTELKADPFIRKALIGGRPAAAELLASAQDEGQVQGLSITAVHPVLDRDGFFQIGVLRTRYKIGLGNRMLNKISGAVMGRVDVFAGSQRVASSEVAGEDSLLGRKGLSPEVRQKTLEENQPFEEVVIARDGYLAEFKPILGLDFRPVGVLAIHTPANKYWDLRKKSIISLMAIAVTVFVVGLTVGYWLQLGITRPIIQLTDQTRAVAQGDFSRGPVAIKSRDEIGTLADSFNKMTQDLLQYIENLKKTTAEKERIAKEMEIGHGIQQSFLPKTFPTLERAQIFGESVPARDVGGDFFDVFMLDEQRVGLVMADVSGKGLPAALFMALSRSVLRMTAQQGSDTGETLRSVNEFIAADNESCMFVTTFYGILDLTTGQLDYANGGHNPPVIYRRQQGDVEELPLTGGMAVGVMEGMPFSSTSIALNRGDILLLYTDGVTETPDPDMQEFGLDRTKTLLAENCDLPPKELGRLITGKVVEFAQGQETFDDVTYLIVGYH